MQVLILDLGNSTLLDTIEKLATILASGTLIFAIINYFYGKNKDKLLAVVDQISFMREKILLANDILVKHVRSQEKDYVFNRIPLDSPTLESIKNKYFDLSVKQIELTEKYGALNFQTEILNMLEELSLRIIYSKTEDHPAFNSIKPVFVELVEMNAVTLLIHREVTTGNSIFNGTLELYNLWSKNLDKLTAPDRLKKVVEEFKK